MKTLIKDNSRLFLVFLIGSLMRFGCEGFIYYPYLDDYVQYMYYPSLPLWDKVFWGGAKTIYTRPLASIFDVFIWGKLGDNLFLAMVILALLFGLSGILFYCALNQRGIKVSPFFLVIYGFCPLNTEGTYWVSASSRIAMSLFLTALGAVYLAQYLKGGGRKNFVLFAVFHFLSYWFYEQTSAVSFLLCLWLALREGKINCALVTAVCAVAFALWYGTLGKMGSNSLRLETIETGALWKNLCLAVKEIFYVLTKIFGGIMAKGFLRGSLGLLSAPLWIVATGILTWLFVKEIKAPSCGTKEGLILGTVLFFGAFAPFYITKNIWFNLRNFVPASLGAGLILDFLLSKMSPRLFKGALGTVLVLFLIVQTTEIADYNKVAKNDYETALSLKAAYEKSGNPRLVLKGDLPEYLSQNAIYHDHIVSASALDWGYTGLVRGLTKNPEIKAELQIWEQ